MVDQEGTIRDLSSLLNKDQDKLKLVKVIIFEESKIVNKKLNEINLPLESVLVAILQGEK